MTTRRKSVILKDWNLNKSKSLNVKRGINSSYIPIDIKNGEYYATFYGSDRASHENEMVYKDDINNQLESLSKNILSDRVRTLNSIPKYHYINTRCERIQ